MPRSQTVETEADDRPGGIGAGVSPFGRATGDPKLGNFKSPAKQDYADQCRPVGRNGPVRKAG